MLQIMKFQVLPLTLKNMVSDSDIAWEEDDSAIEAGEDDAEAGFPGTSTSTDTPDDPHMVTESLLALHIMYIWYIYNMYYIHRQHFWSN